jgi:hypothetical protein
VDPTTSVLSEFLRQGLLGLVIVGVLTGWLTPKWVVDEYRKREQIKDATIERQSALIERLAEKASPSVPDQRRRQQ